MKKVITGILFVIAVVTGIFIMLVSHSDHEIVQTSTPRHFRQLSALAADTLSFPAGVNLMNVFDGAVYAYSRGESVMYRADTRERSAVPLFRAAGHYDEIPASIDVDSSGIWVFITNRKAIFRFRENQPLPDSIEASAHPFYRGSRLTDSLFFIQHFDHQDGTARLERYNYLTGTKEQELHRFPRFKDDGLSADGHVVRSPGNGPVYFFQLHNADVISCDLLSGETFTFQTIDKTPPSNTSVANNTGYSISSKTAFINISGAADSQYLYILSKAVSDHTITIGTYIDLYHISDGAYAGSLRLPPFNNQTARLIQVENGRLYASYRNHVIIHQLQLP